MEGTRDNFWETGIRKTTVVVASINRKAAMTLLGVL